MVWDAFYNYLVETKGFASRPALEGVSRGGLYVYAWAKRNPSRVSCIYGEGLVCDIKSWPGRTRRDKRNIEWAQLLQVYGFTEAEALTYDDNPYQNLEGLASFKVPIYHAIGLHDSSVINEDNTFKLANNYVRSGGIATIHAMTRGVQSLGGHHYPIERPDLIADFIERNSYPIRPVLDCSRYHSFRDGLENCRMTFQRSRKGIVAFLGGSITEAPGWRDKVCKYLQELYPDTKFTFVNAGVASTGSVPGAFRLDHDVLSQGNTDLLFVEAAVNDRTIFPGDSVLPLRGMEGIIRHVRSVSPFMDVVALHFVDPDMIREFRAGTVPIEIVAHEKVAIHYGAPSINLAKEVTDRIDAGEFTWEDDFKDLHPSPFGQEIYFQSIKNFLQHAWRDTLPNGAVLRPHTLPSPIDSHSYDKGTYVSITAATALDGWRIIDRWHPTDAAATREGFVDVSMIVVDAPGGSISLPFEGKAVGIAIAAGPDAGVIEYSVDGRPFKRRDLFTRWSGSIHLPSYVVLEDGLTSSTHTLKVRMSSDKNPSSKGHACRIVHFLVAK